MSKALEQSLVEAALIVDNGTTSTELTLLRVEVAQLGQERARIAVALEGLKQDMSAEANACRADADIPCLRRNTWHADMYEEWACTITGLLMPEPTP